MICKFLHYRFLRSHLSFTIDSLALLHSLDTQVLCEHGECLCTSWCYGGSGAMAMFHGEGDQKRSEKRCGIYIYTDMYRYKQTYIYICIIYTIYFINTCIYIYCPSRHPIGIMMILPKNRMTSGWGFRNLVLPLHVIFTSYH